MTRKTQKRARYKEKLPVWAEREPDGTRNIIHADEDIVPVLERFLSGMTGLAGKGREDLLLDDASAEMGQAFIPPGLSREEGDALRSHRVCYAKGAGGGWVLAHPHPWRELDLCERRYPNCVAALCALYIKIQPPAWLKWLDGRGQENLSCACTSAARAFAAADICN